MSAAKREHAALSPSSAPWGNVARAIGVLLFIGGGLLVLQGTDNLDATKWLYLCVTAVVVLVATARIMRRRSEFRGQALAVAWLVVGFTFACLVAISLPTAIANGTPMTQWLRDAAPYGLFAVAPIIAVDAGALPRRFHVSVLVICGLLAALSFAIEWIARRHIADLAVERLVLPTGLLASTLLAFASSRALRDRRWLWWAAIGGVVFGLFFVTGTRSTLILLAVPVVLAFVAQAGLRRSAAVIGSQLLVAFAVVAGLLVALLGPPSGPGANPAPTAAPVVSSPSGGIASGTQMPASTPRPDVIGDRVGSIATTLTDPGNDASFGERVAQTVAAWHVFLAHPVTGSGPGTLIQWASPTRGVQAAFTLDTPLIFLAKFGLLGVGAVVVLVIVFGTSVRALFRADPHSTEFVALVGFGLVFVIAGLLNSPFEDKGLSFALVLTLGVTMGSILSQQSAAGKSGSIVTPKRSEG